MPRTLITGGAGFLGSHLCERFLEAGHDVVCMDNLLTGSATNIEHLFGNNKFTFIQHNVSQFIWVPGTVDNVLHFASPASPRDYLEYPIATLKVGSLGTHNALGLSLAKKARFLLASTSEVYGDPEIHPQSEGYWGNVNPIGIRGVYDEAKRFAEAMTMAYHRTHGLQTRIVRIFNSILADQFIVAFDDGELRLETAEAYSRRMKAGKRPAKVLVPAFDPATQKVELREASAFIEHPTHQDCFELRLKYGRSIKTTGDHSVFVRGEGDRAVAKPVRDIREGEFVAIPARLPMLEKDRAEVDLAAEMVGGGETADKWDWVVRHPALAAALEARREEAHAVLERSGRFAASKNPRNTIVCTTRKLTARNGAVPIALVRALDLEIPPEASFGPRNAKRLIPNRIPLTDELLWLMGFYIAEGAEHAGNGTYFISFCSNEEYLDRAEAILRSAFGVKTGRTPPSPTRGPSLYSHSKVLHHLFVKHLGLHERRIPAWVMQLPLSRVKHFIEGFRCGDGTHSGDLVGKRLEFSTTSEGLANDLVYLFLRFGIVGSLGHYETTFKARYGDRKFPFHRVTILGLDTFDVLSWDRGVTQNLEIERTGDLLWARVKEVRPCVPTGNVFDFSVPGAENFVAGVSVCAHNTYGKRMRLRDGRALPEFMGQALRGEPITVYGDGSQTRSFTYVDDLVEGIFRLLHSSEVEPVNLGNPEECTILEFAKEVRELTGSGSEIVFRPLPKDDPKVRKPDISKARRVLDGWEPKVKRRDGLQRTLDYFKQRVAAEGAAALR